LVIAIFVTVAVSLTRVVRDLDRILILWRDKHGSSIVFICSIHPIFVRIVGGDKRKVPFDDQHCRSYKMAAMAALLLIQDGHYGCHLGFSFRRLQDKRLG
jgi:hypothetical protein